MDGDFLDELPTESILVFVLEMHLFGLVMHDLCFLITIKFIKNPMLRLLNFIVRYNYRPKIMNLAYLAKRQAQTQNQQQPLPKNKTASPHFDQSKPNQSLNLGMSDLYQAINAQDNLTRIQLEINHQIKIQTKVGNLYYLHKQKRMAMSTKNLVNLLVKVLELRVVNPSEGEQTQKFDRMMASIQKKLNKFTPEDMIRFLHCLKKVKMNISDIKRLYPFIMAILEEFSQRSQILKSEEQSKVYNSFQVISIESNIKLLHSLRHLHSFSGKEFEPTITELIGMSLHYFHKLAKKLVEKQEYTGNPIKKMKFTFYFSLLKLSGRYSMPLQIIKSFVKILNSCKKIHLERSSLFFDMASTMVNMPSVVASCRGKQIKENAELFKIFGIIDELFDNSYQMVKVPPSRILKHLANLNSFSEEQLSLLEFKELKERTIHKVLMFTLKTYEKYWNRDYLTLLQKSSIQNWIYLAEKDDKEYLCTILLMLHSYVKNKQITSIVEFNKLLNLCIESFAEQTFSTKAAVLYIALQRDFKNIKDIVEIFLAIPGLHPENKKEFKQIKHFKKAQGVELYTNLFQYWGKISQMSTFSFQAYREGTYTKMLLRRITDFEDVFSFSYLIAKRVLADPQFLHTFFKKYTKVSQQNRLLTTSALSTVQTDEFRKDLECVKLLQNERCDRKKLSPYFYLHYNLRIKIKRCLLMFKLTVQLLENINKVSHKHKRIFDFPEFQIALDCFDQDLRCLIYKQLFTVQIYGILIEISEYLEAQGLLKGDLKINQVWKWIKQEKIDERCRSGRSLLSEVGEGGTFAGNVVAKMREEEEEESEEDALEDKE